MKTGNQQAPGAPFDRLPRGGPAATATSRRRPVARGTSVALLVALSLWLAGCGTPTVPATFYRLGTLPPADAGAGAVTPAVPLLLVGPVRVPDYLDRPQIVTRAGLHELEVDEFNRWGGSLREEVTLALTENLATLLGPGVVAAYGDGVLFDDALQLRVDLQRLEGAPGGAVELLARWTLLEDGGRTPVATRRGRLSVPLEGTGTEALVAAYSEAVAALSREIASAIRPRLR